MYLETILILTIEKSAVRSIDVCEYMGFSKPSVSRAIGLLKNGGYIKVDSDGYITLTEDGREIAVKMYDRHRILTDFLVEIGVPEDIATADACKIEHHMSDVTFDALKKYLKKYFFYEKRDHKRGRVSFYSFSPSLIRAEHPREQDEQLPEQDEPEDLPQVALSGQPIHFFPDFLALIM